MSEPSKEESKDEIIIKPNPHIVRPTTNIPSVTIKGEFRGDFTRDTFDPTKHYIRVLMQQGRVQLDADWNEQADILLHYLQTLAVDLIGPFGGPCFKAGFEITPDPDSSNQTKIADLKISDGHYYVNGILCENEVTVNYSSQDNYPLPKSIMLEKNTIDLEPPFLVYLDVWERTITYNEDSNIREIALGINGPDTATRSQLVWQVKVFPLTNIAEMKDKVVQNTLRNVVESNNCKGIKENWDQVKKILRPNSTGQLKAEAQQAPDNTDPCNIKPESRYRGPENQLYRVEIHTPGSAGEATFKWSRENSSVNFPINSLNESNAILAHLGRDDRTTLSPGDWVEIIDEDRLLREEPGDLVKITLVESSTMTVNFSDKVVLSNYTNNKNLHLRRWDHKSPDKDGAMTIKEIDIKNHKENFFDLEDGVQIQFQKNGYYNTGDYWLIPARNATGDVLWPYIDEKTKKDRKALLPHGIEHHYAPLAFVVAGEEDIEKRVIDCRCKFKPLCGIGKENYIKIIKVEPKYGEQISLIIFGVTNLPTTEKVYCKVIAEHAIYTDFFDITEENSINFKFFSGDIQIPKISKPEGIIIIAADMNCKDTKDIFTIEIEPSL